MNSSTNLHSLWDYVMMDHRIETDFNSSLSLYYDHIYKIMIDQTSTNNDNDIQQWIKENIDFVCQQIYFDEQNNKMNSSMRFNLNHVYYNRSYSIIDQRLAHGGRRLGALLNRLGENRPRKSTKDQLCVTTYVLIAVLSAEFIIVVTLGIFFFIRYKTKH
jgi:hypothetical protein